MLDKMKKKLKKLSTVIFGMVMVFGIFAVSPISVYAEGNSNETTSDPYTVEIPAELNLDSDTKTGTLEVSGTLNVYNKLLISISSANGYKLVAGNESMDYSIDKTEFSVDGSKSVQTFDEAITVTASGTTTTAGTFSDKLNFTIEAESTSIPVTFDNNDGTEKTETINLTPGEAWGTLPKATRDGYKFNGWYYIDAASGEKKYINSSDIFDGTVTKIKADWIANIASVALADTTSTIKYDGTEQKPEVVVKDADGNVVDSSYYTVTYSDNKNTGTATITVVGDGTNIEGTTTTTFEIARREVTLTSAGSTSRQYNGKTFSNQNVTVTGDGFVSGEEPTYSNFTTIGPDTSYAAENKFTVTTYDGTEVVLDDNNKATVGNYELTVVYGKGLQITPISISGRAFVSISDAPTDYKYDGTEHKYVPTLALRSSGTALVEGTDYTVTYSTTDFTNAGEYTATITGKGNYTGTATQTVTIAKRQITVTPSPATYTGVAYAITANANGYITAITKACANPTIGGDGYADGETFYWHWNAMAGYVNYLYDGATDGNTTHTSAYTTINEYLCVLGSVTSETATASQKNYEITYVKGICTLTVYPFVTNNITLNAGDGTLTTTTLTSQSVGDILSKLPTPTPATGYIFKGWYTDENYTTQVTSDTIYDGTYTTLYAKYVAGYELMGVAFTSGNENIDIMGAQLENSDFDLSSIFDTSNGLVAKLATVSNLTKATSIVFTDKAPATGTTTVDVSKNQDGTVLAYVENNVLYFAPSTDGTKIYAPESAKCLFTAPVLLGASVKSIDMSNLDTSYTIDMSYMFFCGHYLQSIDLSQLDTSNVTDMSGMFTMCMSLTSLDLSPLKTSKVTNMAWMFAQMQLTSLDLSPLNTTNVTDMSGMFIADMGLTSLDLSPLDTSNVTDMKYMFSSCMNLTSLDLSPLKTSKVTNMSAMFAGDYNLTELDVTPLDTSNVTNMSMMFQTLIHVKSLDVSGFNTSKVTDMSKMFYYDYHGVQVTDGDTELAEIKGLENWDTSSVTNMEEMFNDLASLKELNLSSFDTSRVTDMTDIFESCDSLTTIYASDKFVTTALETSGSTMFYECAKLVGGSGTTYSKDHNGVDYAHLDGGTDNPGYFTDISAKPSTASDEELDDTGISLASEMPSDIVSDSADEIKGESNVVWNATKDEYTLPKSDEIESNDLNDTDGIADNGNTVDSEMGADSAEETSNGEPVTSTDSATPASGE